MLGVEGDHALARFAHIAEEQLEQKALALSAVAKDEHIAVRLVGRTAKQVHDDVRTEAIPSDEEALGVGLAGIVHGIEICNAARGQYALGKAGKHTTARGIGRSKSVLLPQEQTVRPDLRAHELRRDDLSRRAQLFGAVRGNVQIHRAVDEWLLLLPLRLHKADHVAQLRFGGHALFEVVDVAALHAALVGRGVQNSVLLRRRDLPRGQAQADAAHVPNAAQQRQLICHGRVTFEAQHGMVSADDKVVGIELCRRGRDAV